MSFPALFTLVKRDALKVPVIGVASPKWSTAPVRDRVQDSITHSGGIDDQRAFAGTWRFAKMTANGVDIPSKRSECRLPRAVGAS